MAGLTTNLGKLSSIITSTGSAVGIAQSSPSYTLDVTGTGRFTSDLTSLTIKSTYSGTTNWNSFGNQLFIGVNGANNNFLSDNMYYNSGWLFANAGAGAQIYFGASAAGSIDFRTAPTGVAGGTPSITNRMTILQGGNVGIGTSSPSRILSISQASPYISLTSTTNSREFLIGNDSNGYVIYDATAGAYRMTITSGGNVCINTTSGSGALNVQYDGNAINAITTRPINSYSAAAVNFLNISGTSVGYILATAAATSYVTTSDYRLKQDLKQYNGLDLVNSIKTYDYEWKIDNSRAYGVIAHELKEIIPYAVHGEKDGKEMQGVDYSKLVPVLVKAIQELSQQNKELNDRLNKLENK